ncbi:FtsW/RodA/SpoVE family cell cycle protein [bacterium]|nr:FtsW/RodA/SpoVE family cell cycle protein [bacterium]
MIESKNQYLSFFVKTRQGKVFLLTAAFLFVVSLTITLAPASLTKSFDTQLNWIHWIGFITWLGFFSILQFYMQRLQIQSDPFLIPGVALLSGWGLLTIWRLSPSLGTKQTIWLSIALSTLIAGLHSHEKILFILRKHKYLWLFSGFAITALTLIFGTNPNGSSPNLWLGCCGIYLQPSEPLKLLLILYLAAYFADRQPFNTKLLPTIAPTLIMAGIAFLILVIQRDLGTASIIVFIYASMIYIATGKKRLLLISLLTIAIASVVGYFMFDVVQLRIEAWINPWQDPSGRSYQIVQSLISIASGGMAGRGPGMGSPTLVPISFSDFIYSSIGEEYGLPGALALIILILLFTFRGYQIGIKAKNHYYRYLAIGLATFIASQSILIIGGNIRLLPLTGVTLPFFSYGGSSLLTSFAALFLLIAINQETQNAEAPTTNLKPIFHIAGLLFTGLIAIGLLTSWWSLWRGPDLLTRTDNARRTISDRFVKRGTIYDRNNTAISYTDGNVGEYRREYLFPSLSPLIGYTQPYFGQAGLEASLDPILRGLENQSSWNIWINHLLYGRSPEGLDVTLTIDSNLQNRAAELLSSTAGAVVLLQANSGEILTLYSSPYYDANALEENWDALNTDSESPLLNRATQSLYPPGPSLAPFIATLTNISGNLPEEITELSSPLDTNTLSCTRYITLPATWADAIKSGCPGPLEFIGSSLGDEGLQSLFTDLGFYETPSIRADLAQANTQASIPNPSITAIGQADITVSPLQMALAAAIFSNQGVRPQPQLIISEEDYQGNWISYLDTESTSTQVFSAANANQTAQMLADSDGQYWETASFALTDSGTPLTWYLAGTLPGADTPLTVVVLIEKFSPTLAAEVGQNLLLESQTTSVNPIP